VTADPVTVPWDMGDPSADGRFGRFGGRFIPETLMPACLELEAAFREAWADPEFLEQFQSILRDYGGRPSILTECHRLSAELGCRVLLKREDLNHTGSHKINNVVGQALLARRMGKHRLIAETGAGQHGVATATAAALFDMECIVYMGEVDMERQALNVFRMRLLGAEVRPATTGSRTLKDAVNEAMRDWVATVERTHYCLGSVMGPHPYPWMVREFQRIVGDEARGQCQVLLGAGAGPAPGDGVPDVVVACVGGGSNAMGIFGAFIDDDVELHGYEAGGDGIDTGRHASRFSGGSPGVLHGARTYVLQDEWGQTRPSHSISAGLDYPGVGPEHAWLHDTGRATYEPVDDAEAMEAFGLLCRTEGIIPAIESAHALAGAMRLGRTLGPDAIILVNLSGRGDKDVETASRWFGLIDGELAPEGRG